MKAEGTGVAFDVSIDAAELVSALRQRPRKSHRRISRSGKKFHFSARYFSQDNTFCLEGRVHGLLPLRLRVKPASRTFESIIGAALGGNLSGLWEADLRAALRVHDHTRHLLDRLSQTNGDRNFDLPTLAERPRVEIYPEDIELVSSSEETPMIEIPHSEETPQFILSRGAQAHRSRNHFALQVSTRSAAPSVTLSLPPEEVALEVQKSFRVVQIPQCVPNEYGVRVRFVFELAARVSDQVRFYLRFGRPDDPRSWSDWEVPPRAVRVIDGRRCAIDTTIRPSQPGSYRLTMFLKPFGDGTKYWLSEPHVHDGMFELSSGYPELGVASARRPIGLQREDISSIDRFVDLCRSAERAGTLAELRRSLYEWSAGNDDLRDLVSRLYVSVIDRLANSTSRTELLKLRVAEEVLDNLGIGEIVFVAPEGPHAIAGGLAQVMNGLGKAFPKSGFKFTMISPLYLQAQGSKHRSAQRVIEEGFVFHGERVYPERLGEISVSMGPTENPATGLPIEMSAQYSVEVYGAVTKRTRFFFLCHPHLADKLYPQAYADEQLRRALFLSRGALELMRAPEFGLQPHIIVTNDWLSGLVPALLKLDGRYGPWAKQQGVECIHMLHNCGQGYQGRFYANQYGTDIWPLLQLSGEHYFGLSDPQDSSQLNLTACALRHVDKAILAVSKPYAEQLCTISGGEGLGSLFLARRSKVFGISNGIDLDALRRVYWTQGEDRGDAPRGAGNSFSQRRVLRKLPDYKRYAKRSVQARFGLRQSDDTVLLSFIGRLAEQKGIALLAEPTSRGRSVLEELLLSSPKLQILIAGPVSYGDRAIERFLNLSARLVRRFPGRIVTQLEFVPHERALEYTLASDIFLMPSRYEPGGISQLEALAAGTLVVARNVGGIAATLNDDDGEQEGNSFLFFEYSGSALRDAIERALTAHTDPKHWRRLMRRAALAENDWNHRMPFYVSLMQHVAGVFSDDRPFVHLVRHRALLESIRPRVR